MLDKPTSNPTNSNNPLFIKNIIFKKEINLCMLKFK